MYLQILYKSYPTGTPTECLQLQVITVADGNMVPYTSLLLPTRITGIPPVPWKCLPDCESMTDDHYKLDTADWGQLQTMSSTHVFGHSQNRAHFLRLERIDFVWVYQKITVYIALDIRDQLSKSLRGFVPFHGGLNLKALKLHFGSSKGFCLTCISVSRHAGRDKQTSSSRHSPRHNSSSKTVMQGTSWHRSISKQYKQLHKSSTHTKQHGCTSSLRSVLLWSLYFSLRCGCYMNIMCV